MKGAGAHSVAVSALWLPKADLPLPLLVYLCFGISTTALIRNFNLIRNVFPEVNV